MCNSQYYTQDGAPSTCLCSLSPLCLSEGDFVAAVKLPACRSEAALLADRSKPRPRAARGRFSTSPGDGAAQCHRRACAGGLPWLRTGTGGLSDGLTFSGYLSY